MPVGDDRALLIYDGDCAFCRTWIVRWRAATGDRVMYATSQEIAERFPEIPHEKYRRAVQLIDADGARYEGAAAVFRSLSRAPGWSWLIRFYEAPLVAPVSEWAYRLIARHRGTAMRATRLLWGEDVAAPRYTLIARIFLQALAAVYFVAFVSLIPQLPGLVGEQGLLPAQGYLDAVSVRAGGLSAWFAPTLAWFGAHAGALQFMAILGALAALLAFGGVLTGPSFLLMWALYLSLAVAGQDFMAFQWDSLLLEAGFLAIFLTPMRFSAKFASRVDASRTVVWLYRFLLFRLVFSSGVSKLVSGDRTWRNLTALSYHFETQPLPTALAWYAHRLPQVVLRAATFLTLAIEIAVPVLFLLPRRARVLGAAVAAALQLAIMATGNFAFFNWLTLALCLFLLDDGVLERVFPKLKALPAPAPTPPGRVRRWAVGAVATVSIVLGTTHLLALVVRPPTPLLLADALLAPYRVVNGYGLFAVMTTQRLEIVIEGSEDGAHWKEYLLPHRPGDVKRAPGLVAPFQPRLDWQTWFAAFGADEERLWMRNLMIRLLQGSKPVLALFRENPFPAAPPAYVRATVYRYRFTTPQERKADGAWWRREMRVEYFPTMSASSFVGGAP